MRPECGAEKDCLRRKTRFWTTLGRDLTGHVSISSQPVHESVNLSVASQVSVAPSDKLDFGTLQMIHPGLWRLCLCPCQKGHPFEGKMFQNQSILFLKSCGFFQNFRNFRKSTLFSQKRIEDFFSHVDSSFLLLLRASPKFCSQICCFPLFMDRYVFARI